MTVSMQLLIDAMTINHLVCCCCVRCQLIQIHLQSRWCHCGGTFPKNKTMNAFAKSFTIQRRNAFLKHSAQSCLKHTFLWSLLSCTHCVESCRPFEFFAVVLLSDRLRDNHTPFGHDSIINPNSSQ